MPGSVWLAQTKHGEDDVAPSACEADDGGVVLLPLGPLPVVVGPRGGIAQRGEGRQEHRVLETVVPAAAARFAAEARPGLSSHGSEAGVAGEPRPVREAGTVTDLREDPRPGPWADARERAGDAPERVRVEELIEVGRQPLAPLQCAVELADDLGDDASHDRLDGHDDRLRPKCLHHASSECLRQAGRALPDRLSMRLRPAFLSAWGAG